MTSSLGQRCDRTGERRLDPSQARDCDNQNQRWAVQRTFDQNAEFRGIATHFTELDYRLNGLSPGGFYVVAGRPSMGKSSFVLSLLDNIIVRDETPALLFTLEVRAEQIAENMLCANARVDAQRLMRGELTDEEYAKVPGAASRLIKAPLFVDDTPGLTLSKLRAKARRLKAREKDLGLVVVDYLQNAPAPDVSGLWTLFH